MSVFFNYSEVGPVGINPLQSFAGGPRVSKALERARTQVEQQLITENGERRVRPDVLQQIINIGGAGPMGTDPVQVVVQMAKSLDESQEVAKDMEAKNVSNEETISTLLDEAKAVSDSQAQTLLQALASQCPECWQAMDNWLAKNESVVRRHL